MSAIVECHCLGKRYLEDIQGDTLWAVRELTLSLEAGTITLLMGPSGSGKTTLLSMIGGLLQPNEGWLTVCGTPLENGSESERQRFRRRHVGYIFQSYNLLAALTAEENVGVALSLRGHDRHTAADYLAQVGLADKIKAYPAELSGGQRQRVAIARALAGNTPVLLADEPTAALDSTQGHAVMRLLRRQSKQQGATVLIVTHDPRLVPFADHIIEMEDGRLRRFVPRDRFASSPATARARQRFSSKEVVHVQLES